MTMELVLTRRVFTTKSTVGELTLNGKRLCYILEDVYRPDGKKIAHETAIPCGRYRVKKTFSPRFQRDMYLVENVPGFSGIRIHAGNTKDDTEGCLLPGRTMGLDKVGESVLAVKELEALLDATKEEIYLTIKLAGA